LLYWLLCRLLCRLLLRPLNGLLPQLSNLMMPLNRLTLLFVLCPERLLRLLLNALC